MKVLTKPERALPAALDLPTEDRQRLPVFSPLPVPPTAATDSEYSDDQSSESLLKFAQRQGKRLLAGWATSLLLHLFLLLLMALVTFGNASTELGLELAFSDGVEAVEFHEVSFEMPSLREEEIPQDLESLQAPIEDIEEPVLELADGAIEPATEIDSLFANSEVEIGSMSDDEDQSMYEGNVGAMGSDGGLGFDSGAKFYGIESEGNRFVFVIDASTSMIDGGRWGRAVDELLESISRLKSSQKFLVMTYSHSFRPMMDMPMNQVDLVWATRGNKKRLATWLRRQRPSGITMPAGAMMVGLTLNVDAIYLLSDGLLMDNTDSMLRQHNRPRLLRFGGGKKTPVHTIGMDIVGDGADLLRIIAEENAGVFRAVQ